MKKLLILPLALLTMYSCGNKKSQEANQETETVEAFNDGHNARNSVSYHGTYNGVIPAADCPGIDITLSIPDDSTFTYTSVYLEHEDSREIVTGKYTWNEAGSTIKLNGVDGINQFLVVPDRLIMRDKDGNEITGELAENYVLKMQEEK